MRLARIQITRELFLAAIPLPEDTLILSARVGEGQTLELEVEHKSLADVKLAEGERPPMVTPTFRNAFDIEAALRVLREALRVNRFVEWGQHVDPVDAKR